jgi:hypothetical protein
MHSTNLAVEVLFLAVAVSTAPVQGITQPPASPYAGSELSRTCPEDMSNGFARNPHEILEEGHKRGWGSKSCESCHGSGQKHTESAAAEDIRNPAKLSAAALRQELPHL